jgi:hypothetical protein
VAGVYGRFTNGRAANGGIGNVNGRWFIDLSRHCQPNYERRNAAGT